MIAFLIVLPVLLYGVHRLRLRAKRRLVAGLSSERPGFFIEPPAGRLGNRMKDGRL